MKLKIDSHGRVYLPKQVRDSTKGQEFTLEASQDGAIVLRPVLTDAVDRYYGSVSGRQMTVDEMEEAAKKAVRRGYSRDLHRR